MLASVWGTKGERICPNCGGAVRFDPSIQRVALAVILIGWGALGASLLGRSPYGRFWPFVLFGFAVAGCGIMYLSPIVTAASPSHRLRKWIGIGIGWLGIVVSFGAANLWLQR